MAGMDFESETVCGFGARDNAQPLSFGLSHMAFGERLAPGADVDFDRRRAKT
jgi:hypothetical protein